MNKCSMMTTFGNVLLSLIPVWSSIATVTFGQVETGAPARVKSCDQIRADIKREFIQTYQNSIPDTLLGQLLPLWIQHGLPKNCQQSVSEYQNFNPSSSQDSGGPLGMMGNTGSIYTTSGKVRKRREAGLSSDVTTDDKLINDDVSLVRNKRFIGGMFGGMPGMGMGLPTAGGAAKKEISESARMMNMLMMLSRMRKRQYTNEIMNNQARGGNSYYGDRLNFGGGMYGDQYYGKRKKRSTAVGVDANEQSPIKGTTNTARENKSRVKRFFMSEPGDAPMGMGGMRSFGMGMMNPMMNMMVDPATGTSMKFGGDAMKDMMRNSFINTLPAHARPPPGKEPGEFIKSMAPMWYFSKLQQNMRPQRPRYSYSYINTYIPPRTSGFIQKRNNDGTFGDKLPKFGKRKRRSSDDDKDSSSVNTDVVTFGDLTVPIDFFKPPERDTPAATPPPPIKPRPMFFPVYRSFIPPPKRMLPSTILPRRPFVPPSSFPRRFPLVFSRFAHRRPLPLPAAAPRFVRPLPAPRPATAPIPAPAAHLVRSPALPIMRRPPAPLLRSPAAPLMTKPAAPAAPLMYNPTFAPLSPPTRYHGRKRRASESYSENNGNNNNDVITVGDVSIPLDFFKPREDLQEKTPPSTSSRPRYYPVYYPVYNHRPLPSTYRPNAYRQYSARKPYNPGYQQSYQQRWTQHLAIQNYRAQQERMNDIYPQHNHWSATPVPHQPPVPPPVIYRPPTPAYTQQPQPKPQPFRQQPPPQPLPPVAAVQPPTPQPAVPRHAALMASPPQSQQPPSLFLPPPQPPQTMISAAAPSPYQQNNHYQQQPQINHNNHYHHHGRYKRSEDDNKDKSTNTPMRNPFLTALMAHMSGTHAIRPPTLTSPLLRPSLLPGKPRVAYTPTGGVIYGDRLPVRAPQRRPMTPIPAAPAAVPLPPRLPVLHLARAPVVPPPAAPLMMRPPARLPMVPPPARPPVLHPLVAYTPIGGAIYGDILPVRAPPRIPLTPMRPLARPPVVPPPARPPVVPPPARPPVVPPPARPPVVPPPARPPVVPPPVRPVPLLARPPVPIPGAPAAVPLPARTILPRPHVFPPPARLPVVPPPARPPVVPPPARPPVVPPPARPPVLLPPARPPVVPPPARPPVVPPPVRPVPPLARPPVFPPPAIPPVVPPPARPIPLLARPPVGPAFPVPAPLPVRPAPFPVRPAPLPSRLVRPLAPGPNPYSILAPRPPPPSRIPLRSPAAAVPPPAVPATGRMPPPPTARRPPSLVPAPRPLPPPASPIYNPNNMIIPPPAPIIPRPHYAPPPPVTPHRLANLPAPVPQTAYAPIPVYQPLPYRQRLPSHL